LVAVDAAGSVVMPFNCEGMYRAAIENESTPVSFIHHA
jgi:isoaspartyl peptidase/L-asparaginase-like protein (Ntn-hydrolase superfamily)